MVVELVTSRDVMAEITRHRHASFAIQSQRYVRDNAGGGICFIKPDFYVERDDLLDAKKWCASRTWEESRLRDEEEYRYYQDDCDLAPQDARVGLPNSTATVIVMKANLREWLHIFDLRESPAAYPLMRKLMTMVVNEAMPLYETVFSFRKAAQE